MNGLYSPQINARRGWERGDEERSEEASEVPVTPSEIDDR